MGRRWQVRAVFLGAIGVFTFFTNRWFLNPQVTESLIAADAVVIFPGGPKAEERFELGIELMERGLAPILFVATDVIQSDLEAVVCDGSTYDFEVKCVQSQPVNTHGNAVVTAATAAELGWESLILVTTDDHITRAHMLLKRCFGGEIQTAVAVPASEDRQRLYRTAYEWAAMVKAIFSDR